MASPNEQEIEAKFLIKNLRGLETRLQGIGATLEAPRVLETNLRFDTSAGELSRAFKVLRLRQDTEARLTYKGPGTVQDGVRKRTELEFAVSDFAAARAFLEALGYQVAVMYEKYRTTYSYQNVLIVLDEMPYGWFAEIEGPDGPSIQQTAARLGLDWEARILESYIFLFDRLRLALGLPFSDLSFANFSGLPVSPELLGVRNAVR